MSKKKTTKSNEQGVVEDAAMVARLTLAESRANKMKIRELVTNEPEKAAELVKFWLTPKH